MPHIVEVDPEYISYTRRQIIAKGSQLAISLMAIDALYEQSNAEASEGHGYDNSGSAGVVPPMQKALNLDDWRNVPENSDHNAAAYVNNPANKIGTVVTWALGMDEAVSEGGHYNEPAIALQREMSQPPENKNVIVAVPSQFPDDITGGGKRAPMDRRPNSPVGEYYERQIEQYPFANVFVCGNEVNYAFADEPKHSARHAAELMVTFDKLLKHHNQHNKLLLAPGIADGGGEHDYGVAYSREFMMALQDIGHTFWSPAAFAIHTYTAVKHDYTGGVSQNLDLIDQYWIGSENGLYIPETGYRFNVVPSAEEYLHASPQRMQEYWQKRNLIRHFKWCQQQMGKVAVCGQYTLQDDQSAKFQSGLFGPNSQPYSAAEPFSQI